MIPRIEIARLWLLVATLPRGDPFRQQCKARLHALMYGAETPPLLPPP